MSNVFDCKVVVHNILYEGAQPGYYYFNDWIQHFDSDTAASSFSSEVGKTLGSSLIFGPPKEVSIENSFSEDRFKGFRHAFLVLLLSGKGLEFDELDPVYAGRFARDGAEAKLVEVPANGKNFAVVQFNMDKIEEVQSTLSDTGHSMAPILLNLNLYDTTTKTSSRLIDPHSMPATVDHNGFHPPVQVSIVSAPAP